MARSATTTPSRNILPDLMRLRCLPIVWMDDGERRPVLNERGVGGTGGLEPVQDCGSAEGGQTLYGGCRRGQHRPRQDPFRQYSAIARLTGC